MELHTPNPFTRLWLRDYTFDRRVVAVDEEWCPSIGETLQSSAMRIDDFATARPISTTIILKVVEGEPTVT